LAGRVKKTQTVTMHASTFVTRTTRLLLLVALASPALGQSVAPPRDPKSALLVTSDIANFWRAFDRANSAPTAPARARAYLDLYIRPGSSGLRDWVHSRLQNGYGLLDLLVEKGWSKERLQQASTVPLTDAERAQLTRDTTGMGDLLAAMNLDAAVQRRPRFFASIRNNTLAIDTTERAKRLRARCHGSRRWTARHRRA
jgi:hypothetical protein